MPSPRGAHAITDTYGRLPVAFEANAGQADPQVRFLAHGGGYEIFLTDSEAVLSLRSPGGKAGAKPDGGPSPFSSAAGAPLDAVLRIRPEGANASPVIGGGDALPGTVSYFRGNDPARWRTAIPTYAGVVYRDIYPNIDLAYHSTESELEEDFIVGPGGDPNVIRFSIQGGAALRITADGELAITLASGTLILRQPHLYQEGQGARRQVSGSYELLGDRLVGFRVGSFDRAHRLVIDPVLSYSTYLGGTAADYGRGIAVDTSGNTYVTGFTTSTDFPTALPEQAASRGGYDAFVAKLNPAGSALVYSTYLGGGGDDFANGIAVDGSGRAYITGSTNSGNFPTTMQALQGNLAGPRNAFVARLNAAGTALEYSTYLGGRLLDEATAIAVDASGDAYVTGDTRSDNFPTVHPVQSWVSGVYGFVAKLSPDGSALVYSTYLGNGQLDSLFAIAVDSGGSAYVSGEGAFVTKLNAGGSAVVYASELGLIPFYDTARGIAVDGAGNAYVTGDTLALNFPTASSVQAANRGNHDAFVVKLNPTGGTAYSTYLGGSRDDFGQAIAVNASGNAYVTGYTSSDDFPTTSAFQTARWGRYDVFVTELNPAGNGMVYSTYLGGGGDDLGYGVAVDTTGNAYVTGQTTSTNFPTAGPLQAARVGGGDAFVIRFTPVGPGPTVNHPVTPRETAFQISSASGSDLSGKRAIASNGSDFLLVWYNASAPAGIYGARVTAAGQVLDPNGFLIASTTGTSAWAPSVAFDGTNYLVVWETDATGVFELYAKRVGQSGALLDSAPVKLTTNSNALSRPIAIAFDGTNHLLAWRTINSEIRAIRVSSAGAPANLDSPVGTFVGNGKYPFVAFNGSEYMVVWHYDTSGGACAPATACAIRGAFITTAGVPAPQFTIAAGFEGMDHASIASDGTNFMVVWHDYRGSGGSSDANGAAYGTRVAPDGTILDNPFLKIGDYALGHREPLAVFDGTNYLVIWLDNLEIYKWRQTNVFDRRISPAGAFLDPRPQTVAGSIGNHFYPNVGYGGKEFFVAWSQIADESRCASDCIWGQIVPASAAPPGPSPSATAIVSAGWTVEANIGGASLYSLAGWSATDMYAVGFGAGPSSGALSLIAHRDSTGWSGTWNSDQRQFGAFATGPHDLWTTGAAAEVHLLDQSGTWQQTGWLDSANSTTYGHGLAIWGTGRSGLMIAVGSAAIFRHYDAAKAVCALNSANPGQGCIGQSTDLDSPNWQPVSAGISQVDFFGVWGTAANNAYAVGEMGTIVHWDGSLWTRVPAPALSQTLIGIWGSSPADIFAVGDGGIVEHFDGNSWSLQSTSTTEDLTGIWGSSPTDVFSVGRHGTILHYDGGVWVPQSSPSAGSLFAVTGAGGKVFAVGEAGTILALPHVTVPALPTAVAGIALDRQVNLSWTAPDNGGSPITGYRVTPYLGGAAQTPITFSSTGTTQSVTGLTNGTPYTFTVAAINAIGTGSASIPSNTIVPATMPAAPASVTAVASGSGQAAVSWTAPSNGGSAITGYTVTASPGGIRQTAGPGALSATVSGLSNFTAYTFSVAAANSAGTGPSSPSSNAVTPLPGVALTLTTAQIQSYFLNSANDGAFTSWVEIDPTNLRVTAAPTSDASAVVSANIDLWTAQAGYNQDVGIFMSDNGGADQLLAWKESGGFAGTFSPNAAFVQSVIPVSAGHSYLFKMKWKPNKAAPGQTLYAAAGTLTTQFSPTRLTVRLVPSSVIYTKVQNNSYHLDSANDGGFASWVEIDSNLAVTVPGAETSVQVGANMDLWTAAAGYNQDLGIFVSTDGGPDALLAWKESGGFAGTFSPNAAFVITTFPTHSGHTYTFRLKWKPNKPAPGGTLFGAGGTSTTQFSPTRMTVEQMSPGTFGAAANSASYHIDSTNGGDFNSWVELSPVDRVTITPVGASQTIVTGNMDLWTSTATYNQDLAIFFCDSSGGVDCTLFTNFAMIAWKESGGFAGTFSPNAATVQTDLRVTAGHTYTFTLAWKANKSAPPGVIYGGAGTVTTQFSPTTLVVQLGS